MNPPWPRVEALLVLAGHAKQELATLAPPALLALLHRCDLPQLQESTRGAWPEATEGSDLARESGPGASPQSAEGVERDARTDLQGDIPKGETLPTGRAADVLLVMDREGCTSPGRCASRDTIALDLDLVREAAAAVVEVILPLGQARNGATLRDAFRVSQRADRGQVGRGPCKRLRM